MSSACSNLLIWPLRVSRVALKDSMFLLWPSALHSSSPLIGRERSRDLDTGLSLVQPPMAVLRFVTGSYRKKILVFEESWLWSSSSLYIQYTVMVFLWPPNLSQIFFVKLLLELLLELATACMTNYMTHYMTAYLNSMSWLQVPFWQDWLSGRHL